MSPLTPTPNDELMAQIMRRLDFHSERLNNYDKASENMARVARVVERLETKVNGNGTPGLDEMVRQNQHEIAMHRDDLKMIKDVIKSLQPIVIFYKVGVWFASALGLSILALIWSILTGQVDLNFNP